MVQENNYMNHPASAPHRSLKERQREERAELILQAAEAVLAEKGYYETSMDEIAARVGVAKGTIYLHYPSKEDLVVALFEREVTTFRQTIEQVAAEDTTARARLETILRHAYADLGSDRRQLFMSLHANISVRTTVFEKKMALRDQMALMAKTIGSILEDGKRSGEFDTAIPTSIMLMTFLGLISRRGYDQFLSEEQLSPEQVVAAISRIYFQGIALPQSVQESEE